MDASQTILSHYRRIADITSQMLSRAYANEWDSVVSLGEEYHQAVQNLRTLSPLSTADADARRDLLTKILHDDASIRALAMPELDRLSRLMGDMRRQRSVLNAYSSTLPNA